MYMKLLKTIYITRVSSGEDGTWQNKSYFKEPSF